ncbi:DUF4442 domain-containing protein [Fulvivirga sp. M361]|uniref:DUF4442 domain-containing protein n=1 Tax=Fulvivirga sp. M361 TaxID=2594266 RepID=UPI00117BADB4|nr:DUF4442 domain-containing protein [Fulvivirga sp. M361]TRX57790.1 DUF4442 domain-containing protein [Fulvivirga sp. M361]
MNTTEITRKAQHSKFYLWLLNQGLFKMIPFNKPHGFKIAEISDTRIKTFLPYRRSNFNHIKGIHACALATVSEFTTGFLLVSRLDPKKYRIIMQTLQMDYHYQGKMDAYGVFEIDDHWLDEQVYQPLTNSESTVVKCEVKIYDKQENHLSTGNVHWQVKPWDKVKTKIS